MDLKFVLPTPYNNNGERHLRAANDFIYGNIHVTNLTVGQNDENVVLLAVLSHVVWSHKIVHFLYDVGKVFWSAQWGVFNGILIVLGNFIDSIDIWIKNVAIKGETVGDCFFMC